MRSVARRSAFISYSHSDAKRISSLVHKLRADFQVALHEPFPIIDVLEFDLTKLWRDFRFVVEADEEFDDFVLATAKSEPREISVRESVYQHAIVGSPTARVVLAHELGHVILGHGSGFSKNVSNEQAIFSIAEWQADEFAAELLIPSTLAAQMTYEEIAREFAVPIHSAQLRLQTLKNREVNSSPSKIPRFEHYTDLLSRFDKQVLYWAPPKGEVGMLPVDQRLTPAAPPAPTS
jgi:hypothetical protein